MGLVTGITLPNNGDRIKVENYNDPIQKIIAQINGNLDSTNILSLSGSKLSSGSVPVSSLADDVAGGWFPSSDPVTYAGNNGNKEFTVTIANADRTAKYSPGMRAKFTRSTTPPTQCMSFVSASSQYAVKTSPNNIAFVSAFTMETWAYLLSYTGANQGIVARFSTNGWRMYLDTTGRVVLSYASGGSETTITSNQSVPLGRFIHIAGVVTSTAAKTGAIYFNGALVPSTVSGTNTSLTQAGDLIFGTAGNGSTAYFNGYLSETRVWPNAQTQSQIQANMAVNLTGTEGMVVLIPGNGNFNDLTSNANNLTATNGASPTQAANPYNAIEYAIVTKVAYSSPNTTITLFTGTDYTIPNGALSGFSFSTARAPYGFPASRTKWRVETHIRNSYSQSSPGVGTWYNVGSFQLIIPTGEWMVGYQSTIYGTRASGSNDVWCTISSSASSETDRAFTTNAGANPSTDMNVPVYVQRGLTLSAATTYYVNLKTGASSMGGIYQRGDSVTCIEFAECAYL